MPRASSRISSIPRCALASAISTSSAIRPVRVAELLRARPQRQHVLTRRCCAPSCRSRSIRRRASSAVATIRVRDAASSAPLSAFATAVATSSVNWAMRISVSPRPCPDASRRPRSRPTGGRSDDRRGDRGTNPDGEQA